MALLLSLMPIPAMHGKIANTARAHLLHTLKADLSC